MTKKKKLRSVPAVSVWLAEKTRQYPGLWKICESIHAKGKADRPGWSYLTGAECADATARALGPDQLLALLLDDIRAGHVSGLGIQFLAAWRASRVIYRFDPALRAELALAPVLAGPLPFETLTRLPHRAVFIETPDMADEDGNPYEGFGAVMQWIDPAVEPYLNLYFLRRDGSGRVAAMIVGLRMSGESLDVIVERNLRESGLDVARSGAIQTLLSRAVSMLLWLCQDEPDVSRFAGVPPALPMARTKGRLAPVGEPVQVWDVGVRFGRMLAHSAPSGEPRKEHQGGSHARPRPHVRRGHWHLYRTGPGGSVPKVLFVHPCLVNAATPEHLPAVLLKAA